MDKIVVMMSSYNGEKHIREQIDSIFAQERCKVSLRVRDDGSKDSTVAILEKYAERKKLTWFTGSNLNFAKSFMTILSTCTDEYDFYAFSDQDDVWRKDKLAAAIEHLRGINGPALYCCNAELVDENLNSLGEYCNSYVLRPSLPGVILGGGIQGATIVMNKRLAEFFIARPVPKYITMHDYYVSSVCLSLGGKIIYDETPYLLYRQHGGNTIGLEKGFMKTLQNRLAVALNRNHLFDVVKTAEQILNDYGDAIEGQEKKKIQLISEYKSSMVNRIKTAALKGIGNGRMNISVTIRLGILLKKL